MCPSIEPTHEFLEGIRHERRDENGERRAAMGWRIPCSNPAEAAADYREVPVRSSRRC